MSGSTDDHSVGSRMARKKAPVAPSDVPVEIDLRLVDVVLALDAIDQRQDVVHLRRVPPRRFTPAERVRDDLRLAGQPVGAAPAALPRGSGDRRRRAAAPAAASGAPGRRWLAPRCSCRRRAPPGAVARRLRSPVGAAAKVRPAFNRVHASSKPTPAAISRSASRAASFTDPARQNACQRASPAVAGCALLPGRDEAECSDRERGGEAAAPERRSPHGDSRAGRGGRRRGGTGVF